MGKGNPYQLLCSIDGAMITMHNWVGYWEGWAVKPMMFFRMFGMGSSIMMGSFYLLMRLGAKNIKQSGDRQCSLKMVNVYIYLHITHCPIYHSTQCTPNLSNNRISLLIRKPWCVTQNLINISPIWSHNCGTSPNNVFVTFIFYLLLETFAECW